jgi:hypothetical protein
VSNINIEQNRVTVIGASLLINGKTLTELTDAEKKGLRASDVVVMYNFRRFMVTAEVIGHLISFRRDGGAEYKGNISYLDPEAGIPSNHRISEQMWVHVIFHPAKGNKPQWVEIKGYRTGFGLR